MDGAANLIVAADHRVQFAQGGALGQIDAVFLQRLAIFLGVCIIHLGAAAHLIDGLLQSCSSRSIGLEQTPQLAAILAGCEHEQFARYELVTAFLGQLVRDIEQLGELIADMHLAGVALDFGDSVHGTGQIRA